METRWAFTPHDEAARLFARRHGVKVSDLPHASFFSNRRNSQDSAGTHLDAPYHFIRPLRASRERIDGSVGMVYRRCRGAGFPREAK
jgi:hypothetical protein